MADKTRICSKCIHKEVCKTAESCDGYVSGCKNFKEEKFGRWIDAREYCGDFMCSFCNALYGTNKFNYCPDCGAKMDGGNEDA